MPYQAPIGEYHFLHKQVFPNLPLIEHGLFSGLDEDELYPVLETAGHIAEEVIAPIQRVGDITPSHLENGMVRTPPGFAKAYSTIAEGGWVGLSADPDYGGLGLPIALRCAFNDAMNGACMAFGLHPMLTQCQIDALERHASDQIKEIYLGKLIAGEWSGTMNISEPQAGSDVGAIRTLAKSVGNDQYQLSGEKVYISWADCDFVSNVCHLVLARLPDAPIGSKGLSLFLAPKFIPNEKGEPGERNQIYILSLEHKMGLNASPTAVVRYDAARAWLIGKPHGGLAAMFTMMNNARLGVGIQGVGVADAAWQQACDYARQRVQGKTERSRDNNIASHPNVRRSLAKMQAMIFAARSICALCAFSFDQANSSATDSEYWQNYAAVLTPIAKAFGSDIGVEVAFSALQVHGGAGYIEQTGASQFLRDAMVTTIYEGTNDIQSLDLVGRKLTLDGAIFDLLDGIRMSIKNSPQSCLANALKGVEMMVRETAVTLAKETSYPFRAAGAVPFLRALALVIGGQCHLTAATEGKERYALAQVFMDRCLPEIHHLCSEAVLGDDDLFAVKF